MTNTTATATSQQTHLSASALCGFPGVFVVNLITIADQSLRLRKGVN